MPPLKRGQMPISIPCIIKYYIGDYVPYVYALLLVNLRLTLSQAREDLQSTLL